MLNETSITISPEVPLEAATADITNIRDIRILRLKGTGEVANDLIQFTINKIAENARGDYLKKL